MGKSFAFTFNINCLLGRSFSGSFGTMKSKLREVNNESEQLKKELKLLDEELYSTSIDFGNYADKVNKAKNRLAELNDQSQKLSGIIKAKNNLHDATASAVTFGAGIFVAAQQLSGVIKTAGNFEAAMSKVGAITQADDTEMQQLTVTARELGTKTQFSAIQSAEAMSYLGMAGWKTNQIIAGMPGLLNLAAAGGTELGRTADIVSDNLTAFGLSAQEAGHMADVYATVITNTNTNIEMLGDTMKYAAPVAHAFGASMEETASLAGLMANAGIKASQAGTALRSGFLRLAGPPKMASKAMESLGMSLNDITAEQKEATMAMSSLGIEVSNIDGPKKMATILNELRIKTRDLGNEEKLAALKAIFGTEAATGWLAVLDSGDGVFEKLVSQLEKSDGAAQKMAERMQNNTKGATVRLQSAMESVAISIGSTLLPSVAGVIEKLAVYTGTISRIAGEHPAVVSGIIEVGTSILGLIGLIKVINLGVAAYNVVTQLAAARQLVWNAALTANPIGMVIVGVGMLIAIGYQLYKNWDAVCAGINSGFQRIKNGIIDIANSYIEFWLNMPERAAYAVGAVIGFVSTLPERLLGVVNNCIEAGTAFVENAKSWGSAAVEGIIGMFTDLPGRIKDIAVNAWISAKNYLGNKLENVREAAEAGQRAGSYTPVAQNAYGGIYGKGAFLTTFAEKSGESAIPHTPTSRNIGLLAETNRIMGNPLGGGSVNATFAPNITVQGGADAVQIDSILTQKMREFKAMLEELRRRERRLSYA